jgi:hypothetical protein
MSQEYIDELLMTIASELQKKYRHMNEVLQLTKQLADVLSRDDQVSIRLVLDMRGAELQELVGCDARIDRILTSVPEEYRPCLTTLIAAQPQEGEIPEAFESHTLWKRAEETTNAIRYVWKETVQIDQILNQKFQRKSKK